MLFVINPGIHYTEFLVKVLELSLFLSLIVAAIVTILYILGVTMLVITILGVFISSIIESILVIIVPSALIIAESISIESTISAVGALFLIRK